MTAQLGHLYPGDPGEVPAPGTPVLLNRPLRPHRRQPDPSRFADDRWHLSDAVFESHAPATSIDMGSVREPFRATLKHLTWLELNYTGDDLIAINRHRAGRLAVSSIARNFRFQRAFTDWLAHRGRTCLADTTSEDLVGYLDHVTGADISHNTREDLLAAVQRIWAYRRILPQPDRLPEHPPWGGRSVQDLLRQNRDLNTICTPRIHPGTMSALLAWSLRFVENFAGDIAAAAREYRLLHQPRPADHDRDDAGRRSPHDLTLLIEELLQACHDTGRPLPGHRNANGELVINFWHLARLLGIRDTLLRTSKYRDLFTAAGLPIIDGAPLSTPVTGMLDGQPWRDGPIGYHEVQPLVRYLTAACFIVIGYLSGMRPGEVLALERGCIQPRTSDGLILLRGREWKGVTDATGAKVPEGRIRPDPWVVAEPVATAIAVLERLHDQQLLFPRSLHPRTRRQPGARAGRARTAANITGDINDLITWVNAYCRDNHRGDDIPADPTLARISPRRLRRTLAWFIARKPRGLVAAAIQYGHVKVQMTLGYAGTYASGFPDELAFEDWLQRLDTLAGAQRQLDAGEHVSGPAADTYRHRVRDASRFAGRVLRTARETRALLANPELQIFPGNGMTCVLDPQRAACKLSSDEKSQQRTPDLDDCRPNCVNIARTDRDIQVIREQVAVLREAVDDPLAPPLRNARERHELQRLERILTEHETSRKNIP
jgi:integrase